MESRAACTVDLAPQCVSPSSSDKRRQAGAGSGARRGKDDEAG